MTEPFKNDTSDLAARIHSEKKKHDRSRKYIYLIGGILLVAAIVWFSPIGKKSKDDGLPKFVTHSLDRGEIRKTITATGSLAPTNEVTVGSELSGTTMEVYVDSNDEVEVGQPLALLDTTALKNQLKANKANLASARASVKQAEATVAEAESSLARQKELRKVSGGKIPSQATMDSAVASLERARADLLSAEASVHQQEAQVQITETDLSKTIIRSPTNGVVLSRDLEPGQTVAASFTAPELFVIAEDLASMLLEVSIAEADIGLVKDGQVARFQVDAWPQRTYEATVSKVSFGSEVTDNVVTYPTELKVANADLSLRPGMTATADIDVAHHTDVFLVPVAALRFEPMIPAENAESGEKKSFLEKMIPGPPRRNRERRAGGDGSDPSLLESAIWVLRDGAPRRVVVTLGLSNGRMTEVSSEDLSVGDAIIIREELANR